jgi:hypothetical protein
MTLDLLYLAGCPNHDLAVELVCSVLEAEGLNAEVRQILIRNDDDARRHGFPGSPTVRVNGRDIEDVPIQQLGIGFACRTYLVEGKSQGLPPRSWLEQAVRTARNQEVNR